MKFIDTDVLRIAYLDDGAVNGWPVILSHGFPYSVHAFDAVVPVLVNAGARVIRPYCRGFGQTRFLSERTMRSGQQVARALDLIQLADRLDIDRPILGGYDWGGNASCVAAALWPHRIGGLVSYAGYDVIDAAAQGGPFDPHLERVCWYQHLFQSERGRGCLDTRRREIARMLWEEWSPGWAFDDTTFDRSAAAFDNPDFVDVVIHCYRWMFGLAASESTLQALENKLAGHPVITVSTVTIDGTLDPLKPGGTADHAHMFTGKHRHFAVSCGHNLPEEMPGVFANAVLSIGDHDRR